MVSFYDILLNALVTRSVINEVYIRATQVPGEPDLSGVIVVALQSGFVVFQRLGSPTADRITVRLDDILAIDTEEVA